MYVRLRVLPASDSDCVCTLLVVCCSTAVSEAVGVLSVHRTAAWMRSLPCFSAHIPRQFVGHTALPAICPLCIEPAALSPSPFLCSILFIILLAAPTLAKRTIDAPTVWIKRSGKAAVAGGKAAARRGKAAASKAKGAMNKTEGKLEAGWDKVKEELHLPSKGNMETAPTASDTAAPQAAPAGTASATALDAAAELAAAPPAAVLAVAAAAGEPAPPPARGSSALAPGQPSSALTVSSASLPAGQPINGTSVSKGQALGARLDSVHLVEIAPSGSARTTYVTWLLLATCLYMGAMPLLIYGLVSCCCFGLLFWVVPPSCRAVSCQARACSRAGVQLCNMPLQGCAPLPAHAPLGDGLAAALSWLLPCVGCYPVLPAPLFWPQPACCACRAARALWPACTAATAATPLHYPAPACCSLPAMCRPSL